MLWARPHRALASLWAFALLLSACSESETQIVVAVYTDLQVPGQIDRIRIDAEGPNGMTTQTAPFFGVDAVEQPVTLGLFPSGGELGPITITATALDKSIPVVERRVRTSFVEGESLLVIIELNGSCTSQVCSGETTCIDGSCESIDVPPESLPRFDGRLPPPVGAQPDAGMPLMDAGGIDASRPDAFVPPPVDSGPPVDASQPDTGMPGMDAGMPQPDASMPPTCTGTYMPLPTSPLSIDGELEMSDPRFNRPFREACPATLIPDELFAYDEYVFCNEGPTRTVTIQIDAFDSNPTKTLSDPFLFIYDGSGLPSDPTMCVDASDDRSLDSFDPLLPNFQVQTGQTFTVIATSYDPYDFDGLGTYELLITP